MPIPNFYINPGTSDLASGNGADLMEAPIQSDFDDCCCEPTWSGSDCIYCPAGETPAQYDVTLTGISLCPCSSDVGASNSTSWSANPNVGPNGVFRATQDSVDSCFWVCETACTGEWKRWREPDCTDLRVTLTILRYLVEVYVSTDGAIVNVKARYLISGNEATNVYDSGAITAGVDCEGASGIACTLTCLDLGSSAGWNGGIDGTADVDPV